MASISRKCRYRNDLIASLESVTKLLLALLLTPLRQNQKKVKYDKNRQQKDKLHHHRAGPRRPTI
jgi:hypothetical protein